MGILGRFIRLVLWVLIVSWAVWLARKLFGGPRAAADHAQPRRGSADPQPVRRQLFRDPECGMHVSAEVSYPLEESGLQLHFCSAECREKYLARHHREGEPRRASA